MIFLFIGVIGIGFSFMLLSGLKRKSTSKILWWICFQGLTLFHQVFFSFEIIAIVYYNLHQTIVMAVVGIVLLFYVIIKLYFIRFIVQIFQGIVDEEVLNSQPRPAWRVPTISELLGNECEIGQSTPPINSLRINNDRGVSEAWTIFFSESLRLFL